MRKFPASLLAWSNGITQWVARLSFFLQIGLAAELVDSFADRQTLDGTSGEILGNNRTATVEPREPLHARKSGGHSQWIQWTTPESGLATLRVEGTGFDALLGVYRLQPGDDPPMARLERVVDGDSELGTSAASAQFPVKAGQRFEIAIDGLNGDVGDYRLTWRLQAFDKPVPVVTRISADRAAVAGDTVTLVADVVASDGVEFRWYLNGRPIDNAESPVLVIPNLQRSQVGIYQLKIKLDDIEFFSVPVELEINSEGIVSSLARNRPEDALIAGLNGGGGARLNAARARLAAGGLGLTQGFNGTQIFNTTYATRDPKEPIHCGIAGSTSYWLAYTAPTNGVLALDSDGSSFDTVLAVYTFEPPLRGYDSLVPVVCDNDSGATPGSSRLNLPVQLGRTYLIALEGVANQRGIAHLNYSLVADVGPVGVAPQLLTQPAAQGIKVGDTAQFEIAVSGTEPLVIQWFKEGAPLGGESNRILRIASVGPTDIANYFVTVANAFGVATSSTAGLEVRFPPTIVSGPVPQTLSVGAVFSLQVEISGTAPLRLRWFKEGLELPGLVSNRLLMESATFENSGSYWAEVANDWGTATTAPALVRVLPTPQILAFPSSLMVQLGSTAILSPTVSASSALRYWWTLGSSRIDGETNSVLVLSPFRWELAGQYQVHIANEVGSADSAPCEISCWSPPSIRYEVATDRIEVEFAAAGASQPALEQMDSASGLGGVWQRCQKPLDRVGPKFTYSTPAAGGDRFYRLRLAPASTNSP